MPGRASDSGLSLVDTARGPIWSGQFGQGPDVIAISGLGDTHEIWDEVWPLLADGHRVTVFDNRGVGRSPGYPKAVTIGDLAADTCALMDALDLARASIIGSSMGGAIAQEIALGDPSRVTSLVLADTWAAPDAHLAGLLRHMARLFDRIEDPDELTEALCLWVYSGRAHADGTVDELLRRMSASASPPQSREAFAMTAEAAIAHDAAVRLAGMQVPTLVLVGGEDRICPLRLSEQLHGLITGSRLHVMSERGHQPFQEDPAAFVEAVREFWNEL